MTIKDAKTHESEDAQHDRYNWTIHRTTLEAAQEKLDSITGYGLEEVFSIHVIPATSGDAKPEVVIFARQHLDVQRSYAASLQRGRDEKAKSGTAKQSDLMELSRQSVTQGFVKPRDK